MGRYYNFYAEALRHRGFWVPITFHTKAEAKTFRNAAAQAARLARKAEACGRVGGAALSDLAVTMRKNTVYLSVRKQLLVSRRVEGPSVRVSLEGR